MSEAIFYQSLFDDDPKRSSRPQIQREIPLPMTPDEVSARGWLDVDVVFVTGDAYVDSPSFANGLLGRVLEKDGFRVAILSQPNWNSVNDFRKFGRPRLAFCISAGNMDSMINHYTASRKVRNDDAYTPGGKIGKRPDRATLAYCQRAREAFPGIPIIAGGIEASLRRIAHYDYWSDKVRRSIVLDAKVDLLIYGMGERSLLAILRRLNSGELIRNIRDVRGTVYKLGKNEELPEESDSLSYLPSYEEVEGNDKDSKRLFVKMTQLVHENLNPYNAKTLVQEFGEEAIVINPPDFPLSEFDINTVYALPFTRKAHPSYKEIIPAAEVVRTSIQTHRGCFGGCSFCAITAHQGKFVQSRSEDAIVKEVEKLASEEGGNYVVSDLNAPTANMYRMRGKKLEICKRCKKISCLCPDICPNLNIDHIPYVNLLKKIRNIRGVKSVLIASGIRTDLAVFSHEFIVELATYHTGGHLKTAPEHVDNNVLHLMNKPPIENYERFCDQFLKVSHDLGKEQYLVPYFIAGFPGCTLQSMVEVAEYLKRHNIRPEQVQDFIPAPFQLATCTYYTGIDPLTGKQVYVPRGLRERRLQHALLLYYNPAFYHDVKTALKEANREDLIGSNDNCLIKPYPAKFQSIRQTSRIKRLLRQDERNLKAKEERHQQIHNIEGDTVHSYGKRVGRTKNFSGGYRSSAREYGKETKSKNLSRYVTSREWDPIDKAWQRSNSFQTTEESTSQSSQGTGNFTNILHNGEYSKGSLEKKDSYSHMQVRHGKKSHIFRTPNDTEGNKFPKSKPCDNVEKITIFGEKPNKRYISNKFHNPQDNKNIKRKFNNNSETSDSDCYQREGDFHNSIHKRKKNGSFRNHQYLGQKLDNKRRKFGYTNSNEKGNSKFESTKSFSNLTNRRDRSKSHDD